MLTEQLTQLLLLIRLTAKVLKLLMSLRMLSNMLTLPPYLSTLSNLAEIRMDKGFGKDAQLSTFDEQVGNRGGGLKVQSLTRLDRLLNRIFMCGSFGGGYSSR
ncbi:hypothetical protein SAMN06298226_0830 [Nitrosovibrio sp. Nv4]|nr:hypothetical protein SAMN06298226_0830 [Nitrosovibrio sp. Nv4]